MNISIALLAAASAVTLSGAAHAGTHWSVGINVAPPLIYAPAPVYYPPRVVYRTPVPMYEPGPIYYYGAPAYYGGAAVIYGAPVYAGGWYGHRHGWGQGRWAHRRGH
jgi:hypothetical protein